MLRTIFLVAGSICLVTFFLLQPLPAAEQNSIRDSFAGRLYPSNPEIIRARLNFVFHHLPGPINNHDFECPKWGQSSFSPPALAIICPHADWSVSGPTAEQAYRAVRNQRVKRIFLLSATHHVHFHGAALPTASAFQTPLGELPVDRDTVSKLKKQCSLFVSDNTCFASEFPLEMQLPYIRYTFGKVPIVPIMVHRLHGESEVRQIAEILKQYITAEDLVIASVDFTHYGAKYHFQPYKNNVMQNIRQLDYTAYSYLSNHDLHGFMSFKARTGDSICGYLPCCILLAMLSEKSTASVLAYDNCDNRLGTMKWGKGFSVSYMSIAFSGPAWSSANHQHR